MITLQNDSGLFIEIYEQIYLTKQSVDFFEFKIKGDISINFKVANTKNNRVTLGYYGLNQTSSTSPVYSQNKINLVDDGEVLARGFVVIQQDDGDSWDCFFISGNANWISKLNFSCKDIRNDSITDGYTKKGTIVYPFIDVAFKGQKYSQYFNSFFYSWDDIDAPAVPTSYYWLYPAIKISTLISEIEKLANIQIRGTLFDDGFFKTLIITPESGELSNPDTGLTVDYANMMTQPSSLERLTIGAVAPKMKAIDLVKWLCFSFGCIPTFDVYSQVLLLNMVNKLDRTDAFDWSEKIESSTIYYQQIKQNNYIKLAEAPESDFDVYNQNNEITKYGEANVESSRTDGSFRTVYTSPFPPVKDYVSPGYSEWAAPYVPLLNLEDSGDEYLYTSVTIGTNGSATLNGTGYPFVFPYNVNDFVIRVVDAAGTYDGYHTAYYNVTEPHSATKLVLNCDFVSNSSGKFYLQRVSYNNAKARVLSMIENFSLVNFFKTSFLFTVPGASSSTSTMNAAYYYKDVTTYSNLNAYKQGLSYGAISGKNDIALIDNKLSTFKNIMNAPRLRALVYLNKADYKSYNFTYIYINDGKINGLFICESIVNYKDATTPVEANLIQIQ